MIVKTTRKIMAAALPQKIAFFCWFAGRLRDANAITTALSPDNKMLATMIDKSAAQKAGPENTEKSMSCLPTLFLCFNYRYNKKGCCLISILFLITNYNIAFSKAAISEGFFVTLKPHSSITASLASAVSAPPEIKAPA